MEQDQQIVLEARACPSPLFSTACHSLSLFSTGYVIFLEEAELLKREPRNGSVGIDLSTVPRVKGVTIR